MQDVNWNDLRFVLALHRAGTHAAAARTLRVNETTVARRLRALESALRSPLFHRTQGGKFEATDAGLAAIRHAERIEAEVLSVSEVVGRFEKRLFGTVRVTSVPFLVNRVLIPRLASFRSSHPNLTVELIPEARNLNLTKREADLAIRLARPLTGGLTVLGRKLGSLGYGIYGPAAVADEETRTLEWIAYDDAHAHMPQAKWLSEAARADGPDFPCLRVADAETAIEAVAARLGKTVLPTVSADRDPRLRPIDRTGYPVLPERDIWLLSHREQKDIRAIQAVVTWIVGFDW